MQYLYIDGDAFAVLDHEKALPSRRSKIRLKLEQDLAPSTEPEAMIGKTGKDGLILALRHGWADPFHFRLARVARTLGLPSFFYWPLEGTVEQITPSRGRLHQRVSWLAAAYRRYRGQRGGALHGNAQLPYPPDRPARTPTVTVNHAGRIAGFGVYVRLDFWNRLNSGGSYGHTCYVAAAFRRRTDRFRALVASPFPLLDDLGVVQETLEGLEGPGAARTERDLILASQYYEPQIRRVFEKERPAYVYERLVLGSFCTAKICVELGIPYIAEYNGSELSLDQSFGGSGYAYGPEFLRIEDFAFQSATLIVVVSAPIKASLIERGVDPGRILVNPNGADPDTYSPAEEKEREALRTSLGFSKTTCVVGFSGTFGGWHGIEVLAAGLPKICARDPHIGFLLIGDGNFKPLVDKAVAGANLGARVVSLGQTSQKDGARFLKACDVLVSPHSQHMKDSPFFGSPTKLFEYMGMAAGIVASDLEQIGEVLSPALRVPVTATAVSAERAILCKPGDVEEFVEGVLFLAANPEIARALGKNARRALLEKYTWSAHVDRIVEALGNFPLSASATLETSPRPTERNSEETGAALAQAISRRLKVGQRRLIVGAIPEWLATETNAGQVTHIPVTREGVVTALGALKGAYDLVYAPGLFDLAEDPDALAEAIIRLTRPGSLLVVRIRRAFSLRFWLDLVLIQGLARLQLADYSPDEVVSRSEGAQDSVPLRTIRTWTREDLGRALDGFRIAESHPGVSSARRFKAPGVFGRLVDRLPPCEVDLVVERLG